MVEHADHDEYLSPAGRGGRNEGIESEEYPVAPLEEGKARFGVPMKRIDGTELIRDDETGHQRGFVEVHRKVSPSEPQMSEALSGVCAATGAKKKRSLWALVKNSLDSRASRMSNVSRKAGRLAVKRASM